MPRVELRVGRNVLAILIATAGWACVTPRAATERMFTDNERAALADTIRRLYREWDFDTAECDDILQRARFLDPIVADGVILRAPGGQTMSPEAMLAGCRRIKQERLSAHDDVQEELVRVISPDAAYTVLRSVYTIRWRDGRTTVRPQVTTIIWARQEGVWRRVHLHESWREVAQDSGTAESGVRSER